VVIFTANEDEQKYQNLYQLFFWSAALYLAFIFYLQADRSPAPVIRVMAADQAVFSIVKNTLPGICLYPYPRKLGL